MSCTHKLCSLSKRVAVHPSGFLTACGGTLATLLDIFSHADARWLRDEFSELGLLMHQNSHTCDYYLREVAGAKHVCKPVDTSIGVLDSMYS